MAVLGTPGALAMRGCQGSQESALVAVPESLVGHQGPGGMAGAVAREASAKMEHQGN